MINNTIKELLAAQFNIAKEDISDETTINNTVGWDSFSHMTLVLALEEKFGIELDEDEIVLVTSYKNIISLLKDKSVDRELNV